MVVSARFRIEVYPETVPQGAMRCPHSLPRFSG